MSEPCTIILITAGTSPERTEYALRTIRSVRDNLRYPNLAWFVADDGSEGSHVDQVVGALSGADVIGVYSERDSYGKSCNAGICAARGFGNLMLFLEDDWELYHPLDIWPFAAALMEDDSIGMVRMGYLNAGVKGETFGNRGQLYWRLDDESPYIFTGHPSLRHMRFHDHAGDYTERLQPGETELSMAWKYKASARPKPSIVWPCMLGQSGSFGHIGSVQSYVWNGGHKL